MKMSRVAIVGALTLLMCSCGNDPIPRPVGQLRIDLPAHVYEPAVHACTYSTEIPVYSHISPKVSPEGACWSNLVFPRQKAVLHLSYKALNDDLAKTLDESHKLTYEHHIKADNIEDKRLIYPEHQVYGTLYEVSGEVASQVQFYVTDSTSHFLRGSLYFATRPNADSLAPVVTHLRTDIEHMLSTLIWQ